MVAVPAFMYAGAGAEACCDVSGCWALTVCFTSPAGNITLGGVPADIRQLVKNAVTQVAVQAVIDLVRSQALPLRALAQLTRSCPPSWPSHSMCSTTTSTTWCVPCVPPRWLMLTTMLRCGHQHVWATRRDKAYLKYLAIHFTAHGTTHVCCLHCLSAPLNAACTTIQGFYIFYNSIFSLFCPLWDYETKLPGLRMVRAATCVRRAVHSNLPSARRRTTAR